MEDCVINGVAIMSSEFRQSVYHELADIFGEMVLENMDDNDINILISNIFQRGYRLGTEE